MSMSPILSSSPDGFDVYVGLLINVPDGEVLSFTSWFLKKLDDVLLTNLSTNEDFGVGGGNILFHSS